MSIAVNALIVPPRSTSGLKTEQNRTDLLNTCSQS